MTTTTTVMTVKKDSFDRFGDDLCQLLLQYLLIEDKVRLESVSKQWSTLIFNTQNYLIFDVKLLETFNPIDWQSYRKSFDCFCNRFGQQLLTFKFDEIYTPTNRQLFENLSNLKTLDVNHIESTEQLFNKCLNCLPNLTTIDIRTNGRISLGFDVILAVNKLLPKTIQSLTVRLDNRSLNLLAEDLEDYRNLTILSAGLSQMQQLKQLVISLPVGFGTVHTIRLLTTIGRRCRQLKKFGISINKLIDNSVDIFAAINEHMSPQLRRLTVNCYPVDEQSVLTSSSLKRLHRLTHLTLRVYSRQIIGDCFFNNIHRNLPRLQYIRCDCVSITEVSITALGQLAHLRDVYLLFDANKRMTTSDVFISNQLLIGSHIKHLYIEYCSSNESKRFIYGKYFNYDNLNVN
ncbi:uncharacterized protein LOC128954384 [Oppia nitens]|uniref:uncharacterized protein LOC128954384 n=1 Tax=Oppia nitens TaxID=1686743 RepID=UPI0023DAC69D|nr:uncharacterized protein LOC128954384 [Oppia nitens]